MQDNQNQIIGFLGKKRCGKDTSGDYLIEKYGFVKYAFADPVKQICKILFDFSEDQLYGEKKEGVDFRWYLTPRDAFQKIGTEFAQNDIYNYFPRLKERLKDEVIWVKLFKLWHEKNKDKNIVITDVRFPHEIEAIKSLGGKIVKIDRYSANYDEHISENYIDKIEKNDIFYKIDNNHKKEDLYSQIDTLINLINLEKK
jgi:dephospho-CoA kinase